MKKAVPEDEFRGVLEFEIDLRSKLLDVGPEEGYVFLHWLAECSLLEFECLNWVAFLSLAAHQNI